MSSSVTSLAVTALASARAGEQRAGYLETVEHGDGIWRCEESVAESAQDVGGGNPEVAVILEPGNQLAAGSFHDSPLLGVRSNGCLWERDLNEAALRRTLSRTSTQPHG